MGVDIQESPKVVFPANDHHQSCTGLQIGKVEFHSVDTIEFEFFHIKKL